MKPKLHYKGWDAIFPNVGELDSWDCRVCGTACVVCRNIVGQTNPYGSHDRPHDSFCCPNAGEVWHTQVLRIRQAIDDMPSPSVKALMEQDVAALLKGRV